MFYSKKYQTKNKTEMELIDNITLSKTADPQYILNKAL